MKEQKNIEDVWNGYMAPTLEDMIWLGKQMEKLRTELEKYNRYDDYIEDEK
jgi:hypothetical protein